MREKLIELLRDVQYLGGLEEKIADHLIANGVTVLPCNVGQEVWLVFTPKHPANPSDKGKWFMVKDGVQRIIFGAKGVSIETWNMGTIPGKEIGKKLFFTCEEAEAALQNRRKENEYGMFLHPNTEKTA